MRWKAAVLTLFLIGCSEPAGDPDVADTGPACEPAPPSGDVAWQILATCRPTELLSVWGTGRNDVWSVGAGGAVLRFDGCQWTEPDPGTDADLWWVHGFEGGPVFMVGGAGTALRWADGAFTALETGVEATLFGTWGAAPDDLYAIGFDPHGDAPGVVLHFDGEAFSPVEELGDADYFKVWGTAADDVWVIGRDDVVQHYDGATWTDRATGLGADWVTITGNAGNVVLVGGGSNGVIAERTGDTWESVGPDFIQPLQGVCLQADGSGIATGLGATFIRRDTAGVWEEDWDAPFDIVDPAAPPVPGCTKPTPDYHGCFADDAGGTFVVGGNFAAPLAEGALLYYGRALPTEGLP